MKPGTRLKSAACDTEVMVIRCGTGTIECGGAEMAEAKPAEAEAEMARLNAVVPRWMKQSQPMLRRSAQTFPLER